MRRLLLALLVAGCTSTSDTSGNIVSGGQPLAPVATTAEKGEVRLTIPAQPDASSFRVEVLDPLTLQPVEPGQTVPAGMSTVKLPFGHWRIRVTPVSGKGAFYDFVQIHPQGAAVLVNGFNSPVPSPNPFGPGPEPINPAGLDQIEHFIIIYMENQSFDATFPTFEGAEGVKYAGNAAVQMTLGGKPVQAYNAKNSKDDKPPLLAESRIVPVVSPYPDGSPYPINLPVGPYDLAQLVAPSVLVGDTDHIFVKEQRQINGGDMSRFAAWSSNPGVVQAYYVEGDNPLATYAREGVLCDHFFHSAFGDTWLNEFFLVSGTAPLLGPSPYAFPSPSPNASPTPPYINLSATSPLDPTLNNPFAIINGTSYILQFPAGFENGPQPNASLQTLPTIADKLNAKGVSWTWYGALNYEISPLLWFANSTVNSAGFSSHFVTTNSTMGQGFVNALQDPGSFPQVAFVRPNLDESLHPEDSTFDAGQEFLQTVVEAIRNQPAIWNNCAIIITTDENGGRWDHVTPPPGDAFGPGTRIPTVVLGPFVRAHTVDHNVYETVSILKTLQARFRLERLNDRVESASDLSRVFK